MTVKTHVAAGVLTALLIGTTASGLLLVAFGALVPDVDHGGSTIGSKVGPLSKCLKHRGVTHSLAFLLLSLCLNPLIGLGVFVHLLLDALTPKGISLLWPYGRKQRVFVLWRLFNTGGAGEKILCGLLVGLTVLYLLRQMVA